MRRSRSGLDEEAPTFLNMVAEIHTAGITPTQMLARMLRIEYLLERTDKSLKKPRTIDLDLLFYAGEHVETPFLTVPHPRAHLRRFVLVPMNEVAPTFVHPQLHKDISTLLVECEDNAACRTLEPERRATRAVLVKRLDLKSAKG